MQRIFPFIFYLIIAQQSGAKLIRSRFRQGWNFACPQGHTITEFTARMLFDDIILAVTCEPLFVLRSSCRKTVDLPVFDSGSLVIPAGNIGCEIGEYMNGLTSSGTGSNNLALSRSVAFRCCKPSNGEVIVVESSCATSKLVDPLLLLTGQQIRLNGNRPALKCPQQGLTSIALKENKLGLNFCTFTDRRRQYDRQCFAENIASSSLTQPIRTTSLILKCKPFTNGTQKWGCFNDFTCTSNRDCLQTCSRMTRKLAFAIVVEASCVGFAQAGKDCCCTFQGQADPMCKQVDESFLQLSNVHRQKGARKIPQRAPFKGPKKGSSGPIQRDENFKGLMNCRPRTKGFQKWRCFEQPDCSAQRLNCFKRCRTWAPGILFGKVASATCSQINEHRPEQCCCTYKGEIPDPICKKRDDLLRRLNRNRVAN